MIFASEFNACAFIYTYVCKKEVRLQIYLQIIEKQIIVKQIEAFIDGKNYEDFRLGMDNIYNMDIR